VARSEAAQEADRLKANLISSVSHSLKTPLAAVTAVVTNLQVASAGTLPEEAIRDLGSAERDLRLLNERIGDILDLSRLETESWRPNVDWNDVGEVCLSAVSTFDDVTRARIAWAVPSSLPPVRFDFVQMVRVLHHLLENALAYSDGAPVTIGASVDDGRCRIWVEDSGPGVDPGEHDSIFETFRRGRAAGATQGTGLGLAIARQIVDSHGGRILIEDVTPHGARFVVELPEGGGQPDDA
jgi:two-component system sensor histidine kinase KdpD